MRNTILALLIWLTGCAFFVSWDESNRSSVGQPIETITKLWGEPNQTWKRKDGKTVYKYHLKNLDPSCTHYWVIDKQGIIENFYHEGNCRPV